MSSQGFALADQISEGTFGQVCNVKRFPLPFGTYRQPKPDHIVVKTMRCAADKLRYQNAVLKRAWSVTELKPFLPFNGKWAEEKKGIERTENILKERKFQERRNEKIQVNTSTTWDKYALTYTEYAAEQQRKMNEEAGIGRITNAERDKVAAMPDVEPSWQTAAGDLAYLVMEKVTKLPKPAQRTMALRQSVAEQTCNLFWILCNARLYFTDCKEENLMLRNNGEVVMIDLDGLRMYHQFLPRDAAPETTYSTFRGPVQKPLTFSQDLETNKVIFESTYKYISAVHFVCTVIDWYANTGFFMYYCLQKMKCSGHTKYYYIKKLIENPFDNAITTQTWLYEAVDAINKTNLRDKRIKAIDTVAQVQLVLEKIKTSIAHLKANVPKFNGIVAYLTSDKQHTQFPFAEPFESTRKFPAYGDYYTLRASFVDKCH